MKIDPHRPRSAHTIPPLRLDLGTDCARTRWRHHAPPRLSHAQGPCACDYAIGFFRRPPCRPQSVPRVLSINACERLIFTGADPPPSYILIPYSVKRNSKIMNSFPKWLRKPRVVWLVHGTARRWRPSISCTNEFWGESIKLPLFAHVPADVCCCFWCCCHHFAACRPKCSSAS